jgi:hypothetical protein
LKGVIATLSNGSARRAWVNLLRIYPPKTTTQNINYSKKSMIAKLRKEAKNPDEWLIDLENIRVLFMEDHAYNLDEARIIQHP